MTDLDDEIGALSPEQRQLLQLLAQKEGVDPSRMPIPRRWETTPAPLSIVQERIWSLTQLTTNLPTENVPLAFEIEGTLDVKLLERCLNVVVERHAILRTNFKAIGGRPAQLIAPFEPFPLPVEDVRTLPPEERRAAAARRLAEHAGEPFDLERDRLLRPLLVRFEPERVMLLVTMNHLVVDGWAINVLLREIGEVYRASLAERPPSLPELRIQYADFAAWQRQGSSPADLQSQVDYWKKQLRGAPSVLDLPSDHRRPSVPSFRGAIASFELPEGLSHELRGLSRREGVTTFTTLLAGFQTLLHRYTGRTDVIVGTLIGNRGRLETESMVGNFGNNILLRTDFTGRPTFHELLGRVRDVTMDAIANQDAPLEMVQDQLEREPDRGRIPTFQVGFIFRDSTADGVLALPGLRLKKRIVDVGTARMDLWLDMADAGDRLVGDLQYRSDQFEPTTIERMLGHFGTLLAGVAAHPDARIADLPLFSEAERARLFDPRMVEAALIDHPAVRQAVVLAGDILTAGPTVAYVVCEPDGQVTVTELRRFLKERLPAHMVPAQVVELESLPPGGNPDVAVLPDSLGRAAGADGHVEPGTEMEKVVAGIWREVLGLERVSIHDNFFDLGGHSLLATEVLNRIQQHLGRRTEPTAIVMGSLRSLAARCEELAEERVADTAGSPEEPQRGLLSRLKGSLFGGRG